MGSLGAQVLNTCPPEYSVELDYLLFMLRNTVDTEILWEKNTVPAEKISWTTGTKTYSLAHPGSPSSRSLLGLTEEHNFEQLSKSGLASESSFTEKWNENKISLALVRRTPKRESAQLSASPRPFWLCFALPTVSPLRFRNKGGKRGKKGGTGRRPWPPSPALQRACLHQRRLCIM